MFRAGKVFATAMLALGLMSVAANAGCHRGTSTLIGTGAGSVVLGALTHSPAGWVGGAVLGGIAGHTIASENCHRVRHGYYDRHHRWHRYAER